MGFAEIYWSFRVSGRLHDELVLNHQLQQLKKRPLDRELLDDFIVGYEAAGTPTGDGFMGLRKIQRTWQFKGDGTKDDEERVFKCLDMIVQLSPVVQNGKLINAPGLFSVHTTNAYKSDYLTTRTAVHFVALKYALTPNWRCKDVSYIQDYGPGIIEVVDMGRDRVVFACSPCTLSLCNESYFEPAMAGCTFGPASTIAVRWRHHESIPPNDYVFVISGNTG